MILLDMELTGIDLPELMRRIPHITDAPVLFVSGRSGDRDIARAFEMGADDHIVKPFSATELVARVRASLRRRAEQYHTSRLQPYKLAGLTIDYNARRAAMAGTPLHLTGTEYRLLFELSVNAGAIVTNDQLMGRIWPRRNRDDTQILRSYIQRLRHKLGDDASSPTYIFNEHRVGYRMAEPD